MQPDYHRAVVHAHRNLDLFSDAQIRFHGLVSSCDIGKIAKTASPLVHHFPELLEKELSRNEAISVLFSHGAGTIGTIMHSGKIRNSEDVLADIAREYDLDLTIDVIPIKEQHTLNLTQTPDRTRIFAYDADQDISGWLPEDVDAMSTHPLSGWIDPAHRPGLSVIASNHTLIAMAAEDPRAQKLLTRRSCSGK